VEASNLRRARGTENEENVTMFFQEGPSLPSIVFGNRPPEPEHDVSDDVSGDVWGAVEYVALTRPVEVDAAMTDLIGGLLRPSSMAAFMMSRARLQNQSMHRRRQEYAQRIHSLFNINQ
tara:strand:- start:1077 stop:1433 length:357 start_codon:yes stop_codon:yes gene_type:complete